MSPEFPAQLARQAAAHAACFGIEINTQPLSVEKIEKVLENLHDTLAQENPAEEKISAFAAAYGAALGEVMCVQHGAAWQENGLLMLKDGEPVNPTALVRQRISGGPAHDVNRWYRQTQAGG